jgi:hypothetical protein
MESCQSHWLEQISAALDGELSPPERRALDAHLAACPHCARLFESLARQSEVLRALDVPAPDGLADSILSRLPPQMPARSPRRRWAGLAVCAALLLVVGIPAALTRLPGLGSGGSAAPEAMAAQSLHDEAEVPEPDQLRILDQQSRPTEAEPAEVDPAGVGAGPDLNLSTVGDLSVDALLILSDPPPDELAPWDSLPGGHLSLRSCYRLVDEELLGRVLDWAEANPHINATLTGVVEGSDGRYAVLWNIP